MATFMLINEHILIRVFCDWENPTDTLNDEQLILHYRFDGQSIHDLSDLLRSSSPFAINANQLLLFSGLVDEASSRWELTVFVA